MAGGLDYPGGTGAAHVNVRGDAVAVGGDGETLPTTLIKRGFPGGWSAKRPLRDQFEVYEEQSKASRNNTGHPTEPSDCRQCCEKTNTTNGDWQDLVSLPRPIQHVNDSHAEFSLLERLYQIRRLLPRHRPFSILSWPCVLPDA